jgi:hypothetical protein
MIAQKHAEIIIEKNILIIKLFILNKIKKFMIYEYLLKIINKKNK